MKYCFLLFIKVVKPSVAKRRNIMKKQKMLDGTNMDAVENVEDSDETKKDVVEIKVDSDNEVTNKNVEDAVNVSRDDAKKGRKGRKRRKHMNNVS